MGKYDNHKEILFIQGRPQRSRFYMYIVLPYKPNIPLTHSILYNKLFAYICKLLYLYIINLAYFNPN